VQILITIDPSHAVSSCVQSVASQSWTDDTEFKLLSVMPSNILDPGFSVANAAADHLSLLEEQLSKRIRGTVVSAECEDGHPSDVIVRSAENWSCDLIVVGSHPRRTLQRLLLGSISQSVIERAPCPVLVVRNSKDGDANHPFKRIIVAVDGSPFTNLAVEWLSHRQWFPDTEFCFATVLAPIFDEVEKGDIQEAMSGLAEQEDKESEAMSQIEKVVSSYWPDLSKESYSLEAFTGKPADELITFAADWEADLVVLGSHGHSGLKNLLLGSVSHAVASHAPCSVLVVKPLVHRAAEIERPRPYQDSDDRPQIMTNW
jgi:nucleotide-binding universal stress UspA family protein